MYVSCVQAANTAFPYAYNTLMAVPGFKATTLSDAAASALHMIRGVSLGANAKCLYNEVDAFDAHNHIYFRQTKQGGPCIVCGLDHSSGEGHWHRFDLLTGDLTN